MKNLIPVEWSNQRVLTTRQLAEAYDVETSRIRDNFKRNRHRFTEGVHFFKVEGENLWLLREQVAGVFFSYGGNALNPLPNGGNVFILYTLQGAARHAKMLSGDKAWELFTELENFYFNHAVEPKIFSPAQNPSPEVPKDLQEEVATLKESFAALEGEMAALKLTLEEWLGEMHKHTPDQRAEKLIALAEKISTPEARDKVLLHAANLLVGRKIF